MMWPGKLKRKTCLLLLIFVSIALVTHGQEQHQTVRGRIVDQQSKKGLAQVSVLIAGTNLGAATDSLGYFSIQQVSLGRVSLKVTHIGYEPVHLFNIVVEAGKEAIVNIELLEKIGVSEEAVLVTGRHEKLAARQMATASSMEFNAEDTRRFAGSRNDVARMASNFAGVNSLNDGSNDIIIRGNSPLGLLWRLEGVDIPNPNHFGSLGATGGPVGMLNNNVIGQSTFYTGAFPAQFGNATAGAFDLSLRSGNNSKREFTGQIGFNGLELGAEGPFNKKSKASYLIYYRYSIPGLISSLGLDVGTGAAIPAYQDISFKVNLPTKKTGQFTLFGMGGTSNIDFKGELKDTANFYNDPYSNLYNATKMGVVGIKHSYFFNNTTSYTLTVAATGTNVTTRQDSLDTERIAHKNFRQNGNEWRYLVSLVANKKFSASDRLTAGITVDQLHYSYNDSSRNADYGFIPFAVEKNHTQLLRGFAQWQHRFSSRLTLNTGVYSQYLALNSNTSVEGRLGLRYALTAAGVLTLAYGKHSQMQSLMSYFHETRAGDQYIQTNRDLDFTQSHHMVAGWEKALKNNWKYKLEAYTQLLRKVPVEQRLSDWSALNVGAGYGSGLEDSLVNKGSGTNYGLELTVERPFAEGYYALATVSVFDSKYKGSNGMEHNTVFNGNYVANALAGKEWSLAGMHTIGADLKVVTAGGRRFTAIDEAASKVAGRVIYYESRSFEEKTRAYFRLDFKLTYRMNNKGFMQEFFVDFQNVTNHKNIFNQWYDSRSGTIRTQNQLGFWPNFNYRIQF
ncbi:TonB-dependent receptor [Niabella sp. CJ426]|uniref:TonB-dependent receptor n=1 Tax=Niabella sp. CJ426 TaxID=3393740 RepID=UPI003D06208B